MHNSSEDHMGAVIRILTCLKLTPGKGLVFSKSHHLDVDGYSNID